MPVPQTEQTPFMAGRVPPPLAGISICTASFISRFSLHFTQYPMTGSIRMKYVNNPPLWISISRLFALIEHKSANVNAKKSTLLRCSKKARDSALGVGEAARPLNARIAAEPSDLALGIPAHVALNRIDRFFEREFPSEMLGNDRIA